MKKLNYEIAKEEFEKRGYVLLSESYVDNRSKLKFKCPKHPDKELWTCLNRLKNGHGCKYCYYDKHAESNRTSFEEVKKAFEDRGYTLVSNIYVDNKTKLQYICPKHPDKELWIAYGSLKRGHGCKYCYYDKSKTINSVKKDKYFKPKTTIEDVRLAFAKCGYELLSEEYIARDALLKFRCNKHPGEDLYAKYTSIKAGTGCKYCISENRSAWQLTSIEVIRQEFKERGYELITEEYINRNLPLKFKCPNHPDKDVSITLDSFRQGRGCKYCSKYKPTYEEVKQDFLDRGYILLSDTYTNINARLNYKCPKHPDKDLWICLGSLRSGKGCRFCANDKNSGAQNSSWQGGITSLNRYLRKKVLNNWKEESRKLANYTCDITGLVYKKLHVHHGDDNFSNIRNVILAELGFYKPDRVKDYSEDILNSIVNKFLDYHNKHIGIVLCKEAHVLFHKVYGHKNNNYEQYIEFKQRCKSGEFDAVISLDSLLDNRCIK
jgi:hypothetical protein